MDAKTIYEAVQGGSKRLNELDLNILDDNGWSPLHYAALSGDLEAVKLMVKEGAISSPTKTDLLTPLDIALDKRHSGMSLAAQSRSVTTSVNGSKA